MPEHVAGFEKIAFNGGPVSFGWLSDDFGTPGVVGDASRASTSYGAALWEHSLAEAVASLHEIARFDPHRRRERRRPTAGAGAARRPPTRSRSPSTGCRPRIRASPPP